MGMKSRSPAALWTHRVLMSQLALRAVVLSTMGTKSMSTCAALWTQSMLMSQLTPGSSPGALWDEEHVYRVLHYGHAEYADVSASIRQ
jgi:hypothetical protein